MMVEAKEPTKEYKKTKVLLAHQADDKETANTLSGNLMIPAYQKLECVLLEENPRRGGWEKDLKTKIDETDLFLLWVPGNQVDKEDWDWFIWAAAGVRWKISNNGQFPIVLLCNKSLVLPSPLKTTKIHVFDNDIEQIKKFLEYFYGSSEFTEDKQPLNEFLVQQEAQLHAKAEDIADLFNKEEIIRPIEERRLITKRINLIAPSIGESESEIISNDTISENLRVEANAETFRLFELLERDWYWKDIFNSLPENENQKWVQELAEAMHRAYQGRIVKPIQSTFRSADGRIFKPILHKVTRFNDDSHQFEVFLVEQVSEAVVSNAPNIQLETIFTALNLSVRIQWEVCENYLNELELWQREGTFNKNLKKIKESYNNIEKDAEIRGVRKSENRVRDSFDSEEDKQEVMNNLSEQWKYKKLLIDANDETDVNTIRDTLTKLAKLNSQLMIKLTQRYSELITKQYGQDTASPSQSQDLNYETQNKSD